MSDSFVDTSTLAKRYVVETGSTWIRSWITPKYDHVVVISRLGTVEIISLLMRKQREGLISSAEFLRIRNSFSAHLKSYYAVIEFDKQVLAVSRRLLTRYPLRTLDAIQLAASLKAAQTFPGLIFISADTRLLTVASAEGLATDDPNLHP